MRLLVAILILFGAIGSVAAQEYRLRPGDKIGVSVWQEPKLNRSLILGPDNMISLPLAGHIHAGGSTIKSLESIIEQRLQPNYQSGVDVTVSLEELAEVPEVAQALEDEDDGPKVYVTGEVARPGAHTLEHRTTIMQAVALAGGFGPFAAKQRIQVRRRVGYLDEIYVFNYRDFESGRDLGNNIYVRPGDLIIVPERGLFR